MIIYSLLIRLLSPILLLWVVVEASKRDGGTRFIQQRLGFALPTTSATPIWIHCASVGEVNAVSPLVTALLKTHAVLITTHTPTGAKQCQRLFGQTVTHCYLPLDWPYAIKRFIKRLSPSCLWVVETEIWPNLYRLSHQAGLPIVIINARLSRKTLRSPQWLLKTYQQTLSLVDQVILRALEEARHFQQLGVAEDRIRFIDNLKYAQPIQSIQSLQLNSKLPPGLVNSEFVVAASTHANEEAELVAIWQRLKRPERLVLVPRHPNRRDAILKQLAAHRNEIAADSLKDPITEHTRFILMDKMGVLMSLYAHAKLVIMGGAFVSKGGHNVIEPASVKACIVTGPDMSDFESETQQLVAQQAIKQLQNWQQLEQTLPELLDNPELRQQMGQAAFQVISSKQTVLSDYLSALQDFQTRKPSSKSNSY